MPDLYSLIRPLLFCLDPEKAHRLAITVLKQGLGPKPKIQAKLKANTRVKDEGDPILNIGLCGLNFENPVGLAAGFDKQCEVMSEVLAFGFGFAEVGTITPQPQPGNPKPRLFRVPEARAAINRFGFNSDGMEICARRLAAWRDRGANNRPGILGINIGKNRDTADAAADYVAGVKVFASHADYLTVNISSPSTHGLRDLHGREELTNLLRHVLAARDAETKKTPIFLKIAPDQTDQQDEDIAEVALASGVDGMIVGNSSMILAPRFRPEFKGQLGGLSGKPLGEISTKVLARMYKYTQGKIPLIGCGGIFSGADAYAKIRAGASLAQLYTALIYEGPGLIPRINRDLAALLRRDGFASVGEAVGADHR